MPRQFYTDDERLNIFTRVVDARRAKKSWAETHTLAKEVGFRGGVPALQVYMSNQRKKNKKVVRAIDKKIKSKMNPVSALETAINKLVEERVRVVLEKAIDVLKSAM